MLFVKLLINKRKITYNWNIFLYDRKMDVIAYRINIGASSNLVSFSDIGSGVHTSKQFEKYICLRAL